jgi:hypothetical protein
MLVTAEARAPQHDRYASVTGRQGDPHGNVATALAIVPRRFAGQWGCGQGENNQADQEGGSDICELRPQQRQFFAASLSILGLPGKTRP